MRLDQNIAKHATAELLSILASKPMGAPTRELIGTPRFHGERTLSSRQIHRLLSNCEQVDHDYEGTGYMASSWWKLRTPAEIPQTEAKQ